MKKIFICFALLFVAADHYETPDTDTTYLVWMQESQAENCLNTIHVRKGYPWKRNVKGAQVTTTTAWDYVHKTSENLVDIFYIADPGTNFTAHVTPITRRKIVLTDADKQKIKDNDYP